MTPAEFRYQLEQKGVNANNMADDMLLSLAKGLGIIVHVPTAEIKDWKTKAGSTRKYVSTKGVKYTEKNSKGEAVQSASMGVFIPVDALVETIADLQHGLELARKQGLVK